MTPRHRMRNQRIAPKHIRRAAFLDGLAVALLLAFTACMGVILWALAVPR